jgi:hypothetical protein
MKELIAWIRFSGAVVLGKVVGGLFYWLLFPVILFKCGTVRGATLLFGLLFISSAMFIVVYDVIEKDLFGVVTVRQKCLSRIERFLGRMMKIAGVGKDGWIIEFALFTWQFLPPIALLLMRRVDASDSKRLFHIHGSDIATIFASSLVATLFWTFVHGKILAGFWIWFRSP